MHCVRFTEFELRIFMSQPPLVVANPWDQLRRFTAARIALGRTGVSLPTQPQLAFQLAHAQARDAVHKPLDTAQLAQDLQAAGYGPANDCLQLVSAASDRMTYLQRPDLGRQLSEASRSAIQTRMQAEGRPPPDIALVVADGLSALAVAQNAPPFLAQLLPLLRAEGWTLAPIAIVRLGRVAVGDEVAQCLGARLVVVMIGERPGLSSPDSMGVYATWAPQVGLTDASRNCISNIRPAGLSSEAAAHKLYYLLAQMHQRQLSGVQLKDETGVPAGSSQALTTRNFLLGGGC